MADPERYTLDTSAVVAYFENEPGAGQVERILRRARKDPEFKALGAQLAVLALPFKARQRVG